MAKGKSKGRNNSGGSGTATIIGTNNADTIGFINEQVNNLGITKNVTIEFTDNLRSSTSRGSVGYSDSVIKDGNMRYLEPSYKVNILNSAKNQKNIIAHELTHIKQMQDGRLRFGFELKEVNGKLIAYQMGRYWDGKFHISDKDYTKIKKALSSAKTQAAYDKALAKYKALPWEKEAYAAGDKYD